MFLSLKVQVAKDWWQKRHRSYLVWEFLKPPEVVIEIVSNRKGEEDGRKLQDYAKLGSRYYIIFDPTEQLKEGVLRVYELRHHAYVKLTTRWLSAVGLGVTLWTGTYEEKEEVWLRWCDPEGNLILTGAERATQEYRRAERERQRAEQEHQRAEQERQEKEQARSQLAQERQRADQEHQEKELAQSQLAQARTISAQERLQNERLLAQLRALGIEPE
jgi:DNA segregation ATPase FtsK/SpoIIIE-like protein